jgi:putative FmdB family regulatory protein
MPTYGYACENCGHEFDEFQSITAEPLRKCPSCGKLRLKRLIGTGSAIIFKGSGFYATDYRSDNYKTAAKSDSGTPSKSADKKETKPKPASAPSADSAPKADAPPKKKSA